MVEASAHVCVAQAGERLWVVWSGEEVLKLAPDATAALCAAQVQTDGEGADRPIWLLSGQRSRDLAARLALGVSEMEGDGFASRAG